MNIEGYKVKVSQGESDGYFFMTIPDLPGCAGLVVDEREIVGEMTGVIREYLAILDERKKSISHEDKAAQVKQVIVIRKDLGIRRGKEIAQGAHASMKFLIDKIEEHRTKKLPISFSQPELGNPPTNGVFTSSPA